MSDSTVVDGVVDNSSVSSTTVRFVSDNPVTDVDDRKNTDCSSSVLEQDDSWTDDELERLKTLVSEGSLIVEISRCINRSFSSVLYKISSLNLFLPRGKPRKKVLPRGAGYDKISTGKKLKLLSSFDGSLTLFAKSHGLSAENLALALQTHFPTEWDNLLRSSDVGERKNCEYCTDLFFSSHGNQRFCSPQCGSESRADASYFGGKRRTTVGWKDQRCQVCGRSNIKGITPHHVLGKENDPDDKFLVALCRGCHQIVTLLAGKTKNFVDSSLSWESLISLVWLRRHGEEIMNDVTTDSDVCVRVEWCPSPVVGE
jgi:hypothetical protein